MFLFIYFSGCGVETNSSKRESSSSSTSSSSSDTTSSSSTSSSSSDTTSSSSTSSSSSGSSSSEPGDSIFDDTDAIYDSTACDSGNFSALSLSDNANTAREAYDEANGIKIKSLYRETVEPLDSTVTAYFNTIPKDILLEDSRVVFYGDNAQYYLAYDKAWVDIPQNIVHVKTPKNGNEKHSCYRLTLESDDALEVEEQKIYR
ncbi:MAG: hypothetical protein U9N52_07915 [Campylobacterota bacterium]|nr:hypothetical protein [Campylobacterota bacterium]